MTGTQPLAGLLGLKHGDALAVVGAGGKSTVVDRLAGAHPGWRVLIMPTTKIMAPPPGVALNPAMPAAGVQYAGRVNPTTGKLEAPPTARWADLARQYDLTLIEADGSRQLPCKGWGGNEPVVPAFATHTLGVVTTIALGQPLSATNTLRLPEFCALSGLAAGDVITVDALAAMASPTEGMFKGARGQRVLLINQVEDDSQLAAAKTLAQAVQKRYPDTVERVLAGNAKADRWMVL